MTPEIFQTLTKKQQVQAFVSLREAGVSYVAIARVTGAGMNNVREILRIERPDLKRKLAISRIDMNAAVAMHESGATNAEIAAHFGVTPAAITIRFRKQGISGGHRDAKLRANALRAQEIAHYFDLRAKGLNNKQIEKLTGIKYSKVFIHLKDAA